MLWKGALLMPDKCSPSPYPSAGGVKENVRFARMLYGSYLAELEAVSNYVYGSIVFGDCLDSLSSLLEHIAETEMMHFNLLGESLKKLGINPIIKARVQTPVIPIIRDTGRGMEEEADKFIAFSINDEKKAADEYARLATITADEAMKTILERLSEDERHHRTLFENYSP